MNHLPLKILFAVCAAVLCAPSVQAQTFPGPTLTGQTSRQQAPILQLEGTEGVAQQRIPITLPSPGLPGPGERMILDTMLTFDRMYSAGNPSQHTPIWRTGAVYSGVSLYMEPEPHPGEDSITIVPAGGYSLWGRWLAPGEMYVGPTHSGPHSIVQGAELAVHTWFLHPWIYGERFNAPTVTLYAQHEIWHWWDGHMISAPAEAETWIRSMELRIVPE